MNLVCLGLFCVMLFLLFINLCFPGKIIASFYMGIDYTKSNIFETYSFTSMCSNIYRCLTLCGFMVFFSISKGFLILIVSYVNNSFTGYFPHVIKKKLLLKYHLMWDVILLSFLYIMPSMDYLELHQITHFERCLYS